MFRRLCPVPGLIIAVALLFISCSQKNIVEEYFRSHELSYPVDVSGVTVGDTDYVGISRDEILVEGAREFVEEGMMFVKEYFQRQEIQTLMPGIEAITVSKPVLYRDETGRVGLMVKMTGFGAGEPDGKLNLPVERLESKKKLWKAENFAYFTRNELYQWQYGGRLH